jgi:hypothetical protein
MTSGHVAGNPPPKEKPLTRNEIACLFASLIIKPAASARPGPFPAARPGPPAATV